MKPTKQILDFIDKRRKYGELAIMYDGKVQEWCIKHGVNLVDVLTDYGCMIVTEPDSYARLTIKTIEETE